MVGRNSIDLKRLCEHSRLSRACSSLANPTSLVHCLVACEAESSPPEGMFEGVRIKVVSDLRHEIVEPGGRLVRHSGGWAWIGTRYRARYKLAEVVSLLPVGGVTHPALGCTQSKDRLQTFLAPAMVEAHHEHGRADVLHRPQRGDDAGIASLKERAGSMITSSGRSAPTIPVSQAERVARRALETSVCKKARTVSSSSCAMSRPLLSGFDQSLVPWQEKWTTSRGWQGAAHLWTGGSLVPQEAGLGKEAGDGLHLQARAGKPDAARDGLWFVDGQQVVRSGGVFRMFLAVLQSSRGGRNADGAVIDSVAASGRRSRILRPCSMQRKQRQ